MTKKLLHTSYCCKFYKVLLQQTWYILFCSSFLNTTVTKNNEIGPLHIWQSYYGSWCTEKN